MRGSMRDGRRRSRKNCAFSWWMWEEGVGGGEYTDSRRMNDRGGERERGIFKVPRPRWCEALKLARPRSGVLNA